MCRAIRMMSCALVVFAMACPSATAQERTEIDAIFTMMNGSDGLSDYSQEPGLRAAVGYEFHSLDVEAVFTTVDWKESAQGNAFLFDIAGSGHTGFNSYELNVGTSRRTFWFGGVGARHVDFDDRVSLSFQFLDLDGDPTGPEIRNAVTVYNNLDGGQVFMGVLWEAFPLLHVEAIGKAGLYSNLMHARATAVMPDPDVPGDLERLALTNDERTLASMTGGQLRASVPVNTWLRMLAGYEVQFISGVGSAADLLDDDQPDDAPPRLRSHGSQHLLLHGATVGCEISW